MKTFLLFFLVACSLLPLHSSAQCDPAIANAGNEQTICGNTVYLNGHINNATGSTWSSSGTGSFNDASSLATSYTCSSEDINNGAVTLTLTTIGSCEAETDDAITVTIHSNFMPIVEAGSDQTVLNGDITLNGSSTSNASIEWITTAGSGTFSNPTNLSTTYTPSTADIESGFIALTLTSSAEGTCRTSDTLYVTYGNTYTLSGTVKLGTTGTDLDYGNLQVFRISGNTLVYIRAAIITNGSYAVNTLPSGSYILKATPGSYSTYINHYLPTYYGGTINWQDAQPFVINGSNTTNAIQLIGYEGELLDWNTGTQSIYGVVSIFNQDQGFRTTGSGEQAVANATVYLKTTSGKVIAYTQTDATGHYTFDNVIAGDFIVSAEYGGLAATSSAPLSITLDGSSEPVEASMQMQRQTVATGVISSTKSTSLFAYPNPASSDVSIFIGSSAPASGIAKLMHETGSIAFEQQVDLSTGIATLQIESLPAGVYILQLVAGDAVYTSKVLKY